MARFERPVGTIENAADLRAGDVIWHVYGIWPPFVAGAHTVEREAATLERHPKFNGIGNRDALVFDVRWPSRDLVTMEFAADGNLVHGHSHNNNYWFRSEEAAEAARDYLRQQWERNPEMIAEEIERRESLSRDFDDWEPMPEMDDAHITLEEKT